VALERAGLPTDAFANCSSYGANVEVVPQPQPLATFATIWVVCNYSPATQGTNYFLVSLICEGHRKGVHLHLRRPGAPKGTENQYVRTCNRHHTKTDTYHTKTSAYHTKTSAYHHTKTSAFHMKTSAHHMKTSAHHMKTSAYHTKASAYHTKTSAHHMKTRKHCMHETAWRPRKQKKLNFRVGPAPAAQCQCLPFLYRNGAVFNSI
jgi:hypothetical protein